MISPITPNPNPGFSYECSIFIRDYLRTFCTVFSDFCTEAHITPKLPISTSLYAEKLYLMMFSQSPAANAQALEQTIREFVTDTLDAESVLLKTWMHMINDFVDVLEDTSASTALLLELVQWIDQLSLAIYHTYFHISQEVGNFPAKWTPALLEQSAAIATQYGDLCNTDKGDEPEQPVVLKGLCYFRGTEVVLEAELESTGNNRLTCRMQPRFCAVVSRCDYIVLEAPVRHGTVLAEVAAVNLQTQQISLHNFDPVTQSNDRRDKVRVEPASPIDVLLLHAEGRSRGTIIDISVDAVALYLRNTGIDVASRIETQFELPDRGNDDSVVKIDTTSAVSHIRADRRGDPRAHIVVLSFEADRTTRTQLNNYIASRQTEILREIRHLMEGAG